MAIRKERVVARLRKRRRKSRIMTTMILSLHMEDYLTI